MLFLTLGILAAAVFIPVILLGKRSIRYLGTALLIAAALQYGPYPFLDEKGRAELLMWQLISLPIFSIIGLVLSGVMWGGVWLARRSIARRRAGMPPAARAVAGNEEPGR